MGAGPGDRMLEVTRQLEAARLEFDAQARRFDEAKAELRASLEQIRAGRPQREVLQDAAFARLQAKLDTMPVIEQAKGVLMAQNRCGPEEAFGLLRRASQRANVTINVLAAQIVERVASGEPHTVSRPRGHALAGNSKPDDGQRPSQAGGRSAR
jgi:predicted phage gp36 major capsid-like protein